MMIAEFERLWVSEFRKNWPKAQNMSDLNKGAYRTFFLGVESRDLNRLMSTWYKGDNGYMPSIAALTKLHNVIERSHTEARWSAEAAARARKNATPEERARHQSILRLIGSVGKDALTRFHCDIEFLLRMSGKLDQEAVMGLAKQANASGIKAGVDAQEVGEWIERAIAREEPAPTDRWLVPGLAQEIGPIPRASASKKGGE